MIAESDRDAKHRKGEKHMADGSIDLPLWRCIIDLAERNVDDTTIDALEALATGTKDDGRQEARSSTGASFAINTVVPTIFEVLGAETGPEAWSFDIDDTRPIQVINDIATEFLSSPRGRLHVVPAKRGQLDLFRGTGIKGLCELTYDYYRPQPSLSEQATRTMTRIGEIFSREIRNVKDPDLELQRKFNSLYIEFLTEQLPVGQKQPSI